MPTSINQGGVADWCRAAMEFGIQRLDESSVEIASDFMFWRCRIASSDGS
jgi:hypothetical protein